MAATYSFGDDAFAHKGRRTNVDTQSEHRESEGKQRRPRRMNGSHGRSILVFVGVVVCCLTTTAGVGSGTVLQTGGSNSGPGDQTAQLSDRFKEPSETVSEPKLEVFLSNPTVEPGAETTIELTVLNTGSIERGSTLDEETATARGVVVTVDSDDAPVEAATTDSAIGSIPPGEAVTVPVSVTAPASADGDSGELDIEVEYTYTEYQSDEADDETDTDSFDVEIEVSQQSLFEIEDTDTDTQVGTDGTVEVEIGNTGDEDAEDARVSAQSPTGGVTIGAGNGGSTATGPHDPETTSEGNDGESPEVEQETTRAPTNGDSITDGSAAFLGDIDSGDDETVSFDTRISSDVSVESYLLEVTVTYEDENGILRESSTLAAAVEPTAGQTFDLSDPNSTLKVGGSGTITAELENTGPEDLDTPVVRAEPASDRIDIGESQVAINDLEEDESTEITFQADVSGEADPGPRPVRFTVEYGASGERLDSDPFVRRVAVGAEQPAFNITADEAEIPAGTTETVRLTVTNNREETLSNINVFLYPDGPLSVDSDEAFIAELDPGESETVTADVSVDEAASQRAYPLEADVRYDDETDEDLISQVYQIPITVTEPLDDDGFLPSLVSVAGLVAILMGGVVLTRRRR